VRKRSQLTQQQLADLSGVSRTVVQRIEQGSVAVRFDNLLSIFKVLNIRINIHTPIEIDNA
jgi:transcriptional regulator with XRE-family HTH domain